MQDEIYGPLDAAIYQTVNGYVDPVTKARGATALAPRIGMQPNTLSNKANPTCEHELKLRETVPLQLVSNNFSILMAYAAALGFCAIKLPETDAVGDAALLDIYCDLHARMGEFAEEMREALAESRVQRAEVDKMRVALDCAVRAGLGVVARMQAIAQ